MIEMTNQGSHGSSGNRSYGCKSYGNHSWGGKSYGDHNWGGKSKGDHNWGGKSSGHHSWGNKSQGSCSKKKPDNSHVHCLLKKIGVGTPNIRLAFNGMTRIGTYLGIYDGCVGISSKGVVSYIQVESITAVDVGVRMKKKPCYKKCYKVCHKKA
jgi:hypothetical protein